MAELTFPMIGGTPGRADPFAVKPLFALTSTEWAEVATIDPRSETG